MQHRHKGKQPPAPANVDKFFRIRPAAASTKATKQNDDALAAVESAETKVFRSAGNQDKLAQDVLSASDKYDDEHGFNGQKVIWDWLNSSFKGEFGCSSSHR